MDKKTVISNYKRGLWGISLVRVAVKKGILTKEEFKELTGQDY